MEYIISAIVTFTVGMLSWALQTVIKENHKLKADAEKKRDEEQTAIKDAILCLLRDRLIERHRKYTQLGHISIHGLQNWQLMYKAYRALGGNGMVEHMNEEIEELQIV